MLHVRSANTMDLAASLPIATERIDMRYQWISRFLAHELVNIHEVMGSFACFDLTSLHAQIKFLQQTAFDTQDFFLEKKWLFSIHIKNQNHSINSLVEKFTG